MNIKYRVLTDSYEFRFFKGKERITADDIIDMYLDLTWSYPQIKAEFETEDEALEYLKEYEPTSARWVEWNVPKYLLVGELAYVEKVELDDDGEFWCGEIIEFKVNV